MAPSDYIHGQLYHIPVNDLHFDPNQSAVEINEEVILDKLTRLIKEHGFFQPVFFRKTPEGQLQLILGGRRLLAAKHAGWDVIPAIYCAKKYCEVTFIKNLLLQDLTPIERAEAYQQAVAYQFTKNQLAEIFQSSPEEIDAYLALTKLPEAIKDGCRNSSQYRLEDLHRLVGMQDDLQWDAWKRLCSQECVCDTSTMLEDCIQGCRQLATLLGCAGESMASEKLQTLKPYLQQLRQRLDELQND